MAHVSWCYSTYLNILFLLIAAALLWRYFRRGEGWQTLKLKHAHAPDYARRATVTSEMTRPNWRLGAAAVIAGCGLGVPVVLAATGPGPPQSAPPKPAAPGGPPPVWFESTSEAHWLAYGNYCWRRRCVNYEAPALRPGIPVLRVSRGARVRINLQSQPLAVTVGYIRKGVPPIPLVPAATTSWRPSSSGRFELQVSATHGRASYIGAVSVRR